MNVSTIITREYENNQLSRRGENKPNSKPIQTQSNPIKANKIPKQTQFKPKQTQPVVSLSNLFQRMHHHRFFSFASFCVFSSLFSSKRSKGSRTTASQVYSVRAFSQFPKGGLTKPASRPATFILQLKASEKLDFILFTK